MISPRQNALYWRLWSQAKRVLLNGRITFTGSEENDRRHELHVRALGRDKSHLDFTNRELDYVLAQFRSIIEPFGAQKPTSRWAVPPPEAQRRRIYFAMRGLMRKLRVGEEYVNAISRQMFMGLEIGQLRSYELQKIIIALKKHEQRSAA